MRYSDLVTAHRNLLAQLETGAGVCEEERVRLIHETDWTQIFLTYGLRRSECIKLIVEVSFPAWVKDLNSSKVSNTLSSNHTQQLQRILREQVHHLEYLHKLSEVGFQLTIIPEEGVWGAWISLDQSPSQQLFEVISPP
jgi:hypothetical protein